ncbi:MAG: hypothetical protein J6G98_01055 [Bacilli bacterium]|nr:hypothetical protein [Bacilli bacterium]
MKKNILLIFVFFLLTGCSVNYTLEINNDLSVEESIEASESISYFEKEFTFYERKDAIDSLWENMTSERDDNYTYEYNNNDTGIIINKKYKSLDDYLNVKNYTQFFEKIDYSINGDIIKIESTGNFYPYNTQDYEKFIIDNFSLKIKTSYHVIKTNADKIEGNTLIWNINSKTKDKKIYLEMNTSKNYTKDIRIIDFKILFAIIIVISTIVLYVYYRIKKANNII